jgi:hypothetical protein
VKKNEFLNASAVMVVLSLTLASISPVLAMASGPPSANPVYGAVRVDYPVGGAAAQADIYSSHNSSGGFENQREGVNPKPWSPGSPALDRARQLLDSPRAHRVLARCRALGMLELPEQAFAVSERVSVNQPGHASGCNTGSSFLVVPMRNPKGDRFATAMVCREDDGSLMAITVDTATNELAEVISPDGEQELTTFNKKKWADCFVASCGPCIAGCAFTGPLWLKCSAACCGVAAAVCVYIAMQE